MILRPGLFLDRDGVINVDHAYVYRQDDFEFINGIFELCSTARSLGFMIFVVTNQAGIGRGYYSEKDFELLTNWMCSYFLRQGAAIDKVYHCPSHPEHGIGRYRVDSPDRKPAPGMLLRAASEFTVDLRRSVLIGDKDSDIQAGLAAGVGCTLLFNSTVPNGRLSKATAVIDTLMEAVPFLEALAIDKEIDK